MVGEALDSFLNLVFLTSETNGRGVRCLRRLKCFWTTTWRNKCPMRSQDLPEYDHAERKRCKQCARILAVYCAHYRSKFGVLPMSETLELINSETMNDDQANRIGGAL